MDNETTHKLPENATWGDAMGLIADLVSEVKAYHDGWATEVIAQAKRNTLHWVVAFWLTLAALVATNAYWIYVFQSYDYVDRAGDIRGKGGDCVCLNWQNQITYYEKTSRNPLLTARRRNTG